MSHLNQAWFQLVQDVAAVEAELAKALQARHGLGLSEFRALQALAVAKNSELRMQDLASHLKLNQSSVSRMVERLERTKLTVRDVCADDKRGVYTVLTDAGRTLLAQSEVTYQTTLEAQLAERPGAFTGLLQPLP